MYALECRVPGKAGLPKCRAQKVFIFNKERLVGQMSGCVPKEKKGFKIKMVEGLHVISTRLLQLTME
jgi:hypothetical protein